MQVYPGGEDTLPLMTDRAAGGKRRTVRRVPAAAGEEDYQPSYVPPTVAARSPYPSRPRDGTHYLDEEGSEVSVVLAELGEEGEGEEVKQRREESSRESELVGRLGMATGAESEVDKLLRFMAEKEERDQASRAEADKARRQELLEVMGKLREDEETRRREEEARRREREEDNRARRLEEETEQRDRRDLQAEKLKVLGVYKDGTEMLGYLNKFERIMSECGIGKGRWAERLFPRLPERLCGRIAGVRDEGAEYEEVKRECFSRLWGRLVSRTAISCSS